MVEGAIGAVSAGATTPFVVAGWGIAAPSRVVTNAELEATLDTSDEWIRTRSGITSRRWAGPGETTAALAAEAAATALKRAGRTPDELGLVILATSTPDQPLPQGAAAVCDLLGADCGGFDVHGACTGYVHALLAGAGLVASSPGPVLVVGSERMSAIVDPDERGTAVLFGDGAGALLLEPVGTASTAPAPGLVAWNAGTDGALRSMLEVPEGDRYLRMVGGEVFRKAVRVIVESGEAVLAAAGVSGADVDAFVPHQANSRIIEAARARLGIAEAATVVDVAEWGNTSAASIPIALATAAEAGRLHDGDLVLTAGFGAGMTWASALLRWSSQPTAPPDDDQPTTIPGAMTDEP